MANNKQSGNEEKNNQEREKTKIVRMNLVLSEDTYEYIKKVGSARKGSMTAYIEYLVNQDREAWKENEKALREILDR